MLTFTLPKPSLPMKKSLLRLLAIVVLAVLAVWAREFYPKLGFQRQCKRPKISINTSDDVVPKWYEIRYSGKTSDGTIVYLLFEDWGRDYSHIMVDNVMYPINGRLTEGWLRADDIILTEDQVVSQWGIEPIGSFDNREKITLITPWWKFIAKKHSPWSDPQMSWNDKILEDTHEYVDIWIVNKNCLQQW